MTGGRNGGGQGQASDSPICAGAGNADHAVVAWCGNLPVEAGLFNSEIERIKSHDRNEREAKQSRLLTSDHNRHPAILASRIFFPGSNGVY